MRVAKDHLLGLKPDATGAAAPRSMLRMDLHVRFYLNKDTAGLKKKKKKPL